MNQQQPNSFRTGPDERGRFGDFGGRFVSETLMPLILDLEAEYEKAKTDAAFWAEMDDLWKHYVGRPSPLYFAERLTERLGGAKVYFKRDELNHTGAHKINNVLGQILLARRMGKTRIIAETGAGQHGVATATVCARFGLQCVVFMGATDVERQKPNVFRMKLLGAEVVPVTSGRGTLKDAMNEALRDWVTNVARHLLLHRHGGGAASLSGDGARLPVDHRQGDARADAGARGAAAGHAGRLHRRRVERDGAVPPVPRRPGRCGSSASRPAATASTSGWSTRPRLTGGRPGVLHGNRTYLLQDADGQIIEGHSISAGLDYPGIGPEHAWLHDVGPGRVRERHRRRGARGLPALLRHRGNHPGARAGACPGARRRRSRPALPADHLLVMNMCGRGDKDIFTVAEALGIAIEA